MNIGLANSLDEHNTRQVLSCTSSTSPSRGAPTRRWRREAGRCETRTRSSSCGARSAAGRRSSPRRRLTAGASIQSCRGQPGAVSLADVSHICGGLLPFAFSSIGWSMRLCSPVPALLRVSNKHSVQTQSPRVAGYRRADSGLGSSRVPSVSQHEISKPKKWDNHLKCRRGRRGE